MTIARPTERPATPESLVHRRRRPITSWLAGPDRDRRILRALVAIAVVSWVASLRRATNADEGGYLLVGSQWAPGTSLYGNYWVDRPPGLIAVFALASALGGVVALRLIGALAAVMAVVVASRLTRLAAPGRLQWVAPALATAMMTTPIFENGWVNGEVVAVPLVLAGFTATLHAYRARRGRADLAWSATAGALGMLALSMKQNFIDVFLFIVVVPLARRVPWRLGLRRVLVSAGSAFVVGVLILTGSAARGTSPVGLWDAIIWFRLQAMAVGTPRNWKGDLLSLLLLVVVLSASMVPVAVRGAVRALRNRPRAALPADLRRPALAVLSWELFVIVFGGAGTTAPHYLTGLTPGVMLLTVAGLQHLEPGDRGIRRLFQRGAALAVASSIVVSAATVVVNPLGGQQSAVDYLRATAQPHDTAVTVLGMPNVIQQAGLTSPYPYLWSLMAELRDPQLQQFSTLLDGPDRPTWVLVSSSVIGPDTNELPTVQTALDAHYTETKVVPGWQYLGIQLSRWTIYRADAGTSR